ncbi:MAG TPA: EcsC family protein [Myxococcales bacterium]|jgi:hypothetical protein
MAKREEGGTKQGEALLKAVERIVDAPAKIRAQVDAAAEKIRASLPDDATDAQVCGALERDLVSHYSNRTALAGGAAALPGLIPGLGSLAAVLGGGLLDMTFCLKYEVEMVLALAASRGYDIEDPRERQLAYLLAAAHTYEASGGRNPLPDLVKTEIDAIWHYTPRQLGKLVAALFVKLAILFAGKSLSRAIPFIGIVVSSAANKTLTSRVGKSVIKALDGRASANAEKAKPAAKAKAAPKKAPARKKKPAA